ncbi:hypothetical protein [Alkalicoccobacillus gibsonii]|uniref:hypothetical protein n=1 Tax=Alkalicoccobacillus gibsonii TaxID=79881 RepID=UPI0035129472
MKKMINLALVATLTVGVLMACNNNEGNDSSTTEPSNGDTGTSDNDNESDVEADDSSDNEGSSEGLTDKRDSDKNSEDSGDSDVNLGEGTTEDQPDLRLGDTGKIETNLNIIEVTLNDLTIEESINGETPERENFLVADITLKNVADEPLDIEEAVDVLEIASSLDGSGGSDYSHYYDAIEPMQGELASGEQIEGQLLFEEDSYDEYYIRVSLGLVASGGAKNQAIWTINKDEIE